MQFVPKLTGDRPCGAIHLRAFIDVVLKNQFSDGDRYVIYKLLLSALARIDELDSSVVLYGEHSSGTVPPFCGNYKPDLKDRSYFDWKSSMNQHAMLSQTLHPEGDCKEYDGCWELKTFDYLQKMNKL